MTEQTNRLNLVPSGCRNACLQMLYAIESFHSSVESFRKKGPLLAELFKMFQSMAPLKSNSLNLPTATDIEALQNLLFAKQSSIQLNTIKNGDVSQLYLVALLQAAHQECNQPANQQLMNPNFKATSALQAINFQLEYVNNSRLAHLVLIQQENKFSCKTCVTENRNWTTDWMLQIDQLSPQNTLKDSLTSTMMDRYRCDTCNSIQPCIKNRSVTRVGKLVFITLRQVRLDASQVTDSITVDQTLILCSQKFILCTALLSIKEHKSDENWMVLTLDSDQTWLKHDGGSTTKLSQNQAKQLVDQYGLVLVYIERNDQSPSEVMVVTDDLDGLFPDMQEQDVKADSPTENAETQLTSPSKMNLSDDLANKSPQPSHKDTYVEAYEYCGLANLGLSCYANACLQALFTSTLIRQAIVNHSQKGPFHKSLAELFELMQAKSLLPQSPLAMSISVQPDKFLGQFCAAKPAFQINQTADAQEFLTLLLELIHQEENTAKKLNKAEEQANPRTATQAWNNHMAHFDNSYLSKMMMGQLQTRLICIKCRSLKLSWSCIWQLTVNIPAGQSKEKDITLNNCIDEYQKEEVSWSSTEL